MERNKTNSKKQKLESLLTSCVVSNTYLESCV